MKTERLEKKLKEDLKSLSRHKFKHVNACQRNAPLKHYVILNHVTSRIYTPVVESVSISGLLDRLNSSSAWSIVAFAQTPACQDMTCTDLTGGGGLVCDWVRFTVLKGKYLLSTARPHTPAYICQQFYILGNSLFYYSFFLKMYSTCADNYVL